MIYDFSLGILVIRNKKFKMTGYITGFNFRLYVSFRVTSVHNHTHSQPGSLSGNVIKNEFFKCDIFVLLVRLIFLL